MKSPFRYPGAKNKLLPKILPVIETSLKNTECFCDAFVGGGSVLLEVAEKYPNIPLYANDKDWFVYCFWYVLSNDDNDINELKKLIEQKPTIELYYKLRDHKPQNKIEAAYRAIFFNKTSFSGDMRRGASPIGGKNQTSKYTVDCRYNAAKIIAKIEIINNLLLGRTLVTNEDINNYSIINDNKEITIYLDPPYYNKGKMLYQEYMKNNEHITLALYLKDKYNWILSYDHCPEILELYKFARIDTIDANYCINGEKTNWSKKLELIITPKLSGDQG